MAKKKITSKQLQMSFNLPAKTKNTASDAFKKATQSVKSYGQKAAENVSKKAPSTAVVKSGTNYPAVKSNKSTAVAKPNNSSKAPAVVKPKVTISSKKVSDGIYSKQFPKYTDFTDVTKKASKGSKAGKAALIAAGIGVTAYAGKKAYDAYQDNKKKGTAIKAGAKKAASTVKKPDTKKVETKKPEVPKKTPEKTTSKKVTAIKDAAKKAAESSTKTSNPKFVKGYVEGLERPGAKKPAAKKPVTSSKVIGAVKATVTGKNTTKIETNLKKDTPKVNNTSIEQKAKDVMSGKYGSGADRKKALGADYDKVQAIINKQMASSKPKTTPAKTVTAPEKMEIKKAGPIEYTGPKELAMTAEQKMNANIDKSKKEKMRKGGQVLPKAQYGKIVKTAANYIKPAMGAAKSATKSAKIGVKQLSDKYKKAKVDSYNKKTANLKRSEDWEKFKAAESDKKLQRTLIGIAGGSTALALYPNKKKSKKK
jgi:hypothetical protein